jgi:hypothetical protein
LKELEAPSHAPEIGGKDLEDDNSDYLEVDLEIQHDFISLHPSKAQI